MYVQQKKAWENKKEDEDSPTVATESVSITAAVGAHEGRGVAKFQIPGTYVHKKIDKYVVMFLEESLSEIMFKVTPKI